MCIRDRNGNEENEINLEVEVDTLVEQALELDQNDQPELVDNNKSAPSNIYS